MTYFITAYTNNMLIVSETRTTDAEIVPLIVASLTARGYHVTQRSED